MSELVKSVSNCKSEKMTLQISHALLKNVRVNVNREDYS